MDSSRNLNGKVIPRRIRISNGLADQQRWCMVRSFALSATYMLQDVQSKMIKTIECPHMHIVCRGPVQSPQQYFAHPVFDASNN